MTNTLKRLRIARGILHSPPIGEGCIVLNLERGTILSLNDTGALMFSKLAASCTGLTRDELVRTIAPEFENTETSRIEAAVDHLLERLESTGTLRSEQTPARARNLKTRLADRAPIFIRPVLELLLIVKAYTLAALVLLLTTEGVRRLGGFSSLQRTVEQWALGVNEQTTGTTIPGACAAVNRACTWHPKRALCLQRASVLVCLLRSLGFPAEMVIGVHKMPFYGHAWVEVDGEVVNDHANAQKFFQVLSRC